MLSRIICVCADGRTGCFLGGAVLLMGCQTSRAKHGLQHLQQVWKDSSPDVASDVSAAWE